MLKDKTGFTLFEVLIGITVGTMLLGLVLAIYTLTIRSLAAAENRTELSHNARIIIDRLTRDIRQAQQIATPLPANNADPNLAPAHELEMEDGHDATAITYIRYYLDGTDLRRQTKKYYFPAEPSKLVTYDAVDDFGNPPAVTILANDLTGQYVTSLDFYGLNLIHIDLKLSKGTVTDPVATIVYGRNL